MKYLFIDTETTGLDPDKHEVIQLGVVVADVQPGPLGSAFSVRRSWEAWFEPRWPDLAEPEALRVNGYPARWQGRVMADRKSALQMLLADAKGAILAGHNVGFDIAFLDSECLGEDLPLLSRTASHRKLDTQSLAMLDYVTGQIPGAGLKSLHERYGLFADASEQHTALADALASLRLANVYLARWPAPQLSIPGVLQ